MSSRPILILHGPNLNLLGSREPDIYGTQTLADIDAMLLALANDSGVALKMLQSNSEGDLIDAIQVGISESSGLLINPGGYTHTSVALRDAIAAYPHPSIEVHLSNTMAREAFRHHSLISPVVTGTIMGLGAESYRLGLLWLLGRIANDTVRMAK
jgi:3-dehydroquinate dehydratase II